MGLDGNALRHLDGVSCDAELDFIQECLKRFFAAERGGASQAPAANLSPALTFDIAKFNKVANFVALGLPAARCPDDLRERLDVYRRKTIALNSATMSSMLAVSDALGAARLDFAFIKGPVQQKLLYGDFFMKPSGDVDVLVPPDVFPAARRALAEIGFRPAAGSQSLWWTRFLGEQHLVSAGPRSAVVDLHHRLQQPGMPSPRDPSSFLQHKREVDCAGALVPFIAPPHIVLLASISIAKAFYNREPCADHVCDLHKALSGLTSAERQALPAYAERQGLSEILLFAVRASEILLGTAAAELPQHYSRILPGLRDEDIRNIILAPWLSEIAWPKRREVLWALCGRKPIRYLSEAGWAVLAEFSRRLFERPATG